MASSINATAILSTVLGDTPLANLTVITMGLSVALLAAILLLGQSGASQPLTFPLVRRREEPHTPGWDYWDERDSQYSEDYQEET